MKRTLVTIAFIVLTIGVFAQKPRVKNNPEYDDKPIHFGYTLGLNGMDFTFGRPVYRKGTNDSMYVDLAQKTLGFQVGMVSDFRLGEYFNLRILPSFNFGQRNLSFFTDSIVSTTQSTMRTINVMKLESSMLDLPILLKYKAKRINNYRPYMIGGVSVRYDLASKKKTDKDQNLFVLLKPLDFYTEMGFGIDYYLPYFKFSTEIKLSLGWLDVLNPNVDNHPEYTRAIKSLHSNILMFSLYFE